MNAAIRRAPRLPSSRSGNNFRRIRRYGECVGISNYYHTRECCEDWKVVRKRPLSGQRLYHGSLPSPGGASLEDSNVVITSTRKANYDSVDNAPANSGSANTNGSVVASSSYHPESQELTAFVDSLLEQTRRLMDYGEEPNEDEKYGESTTFNDTTTSTTTTCPQQNAHHVIAFSGGIDSSVVAALLNRVATETASQVHASEKVTAVLGLSPAVPLDQRELAVQVASTIGVELEQIATTEGTDELYVANDGRACLACKTHLYDNLATIAKAYGRTTEDDSLGCSWTTFLYNGTNADDLEDPTRLGLIAAQEFAVRSPLAHLPKDTVRAVGRHLGLPNWNYAASPCLRSRLAVGVHATPQSLRDVGGAEAFVKQHALNGGEVWDETKSLRVRILSKNRAMIEVDDEDLLRAIDDRLATHPAWKTYFLDELNFASVGVRKFKTGSVAPRVTPSSPNATRMDPRRVATIVGPGGVTRKLRRRP